MAFFCQYSAHRAPSVANFYRKSCPSKQRVMVVEGGFRGWEAHHLPIQQVDISWRYLPLLSRVLSSPEAPDLTVALGGGLGLVALRLGPQEVAAEDIYCKMIFLTLQRCAFCIFLLFGHVDADDAADAADAATLGAAAGRAQAASGAVACAASAAVAWAAAPAAWSVEARACGAHGDASDDANRKA
eukprot:s2476_g5.t1